MRFGPALLLCALLPATARAAGHGETAVSGGPGLAVLVAGATQVGVAGDLRLLRGLSDSWSARLGLEAAWLPSTDERPATRLSAGALGLTVAADVLSLVPFADFGVVVADLRSAGLAAQQRVGGELTLGADYLAGRHVTLSVLGRVDYFALRLAGAHGPRPVLVVLALALGYVF
jgi:hypothetical protein